MDSLRTLNNLQLPCLKVIQHSNHLCPVPGKQRILLNELHIFADTPLETRVGSVSDRGYYHQVGWQLDLLRECSECHSVESF